VKPVCVVTGASGRLGTALCRALCKDYTVVAVYRTRVPSLPSQLRWLAEPGPQGGLTPVAPESRVFCVQADLTLREDIRRLVEVVLAKFDAIDVLISAAGDVNPHGKLLELWHDEPYAEDQIRLNALAPLELISAIHQSFWKDQARSNAWLNRCVIIVSCMSGITVYDDAGLGITGAAAAALNLLTLYASLELASYGIRANVFCAPRSKDAKALARTVQGIEQLLSCKATGTIVPA
jgi:NAD(P)-dependent dehydrogenase (short-subunit alcohol dehydrogenase family)